MAVPKDTAKVLFQDRPLVAAIMSSSVFWLVSGIAIQAVNSLGIVQLQLGKLLTSVMSAMIGLGIAVGSVMAGRLCGDRANGKVIRMGLWGIVGCLVMLSISFPVAGEGPSAYRHLLGFRGSLVVLALLGWLCRAPPIWPTRLCSWPRS